MTKLIQKDYQYKINYYLGEIYEILQRLDFDLMHQRLNISSLQEALLMLHLPSMTKFFSITFPITVFWLRIKSFWA